jgi:hypothetical protein
VALDLSRLKGFESEYRIVPVEEFFVDDKYQRPLSTLWKEIAEDFLPPLVGTLVVSERARKNQPKLALIDGQTRWTGAKEAGVLMLPALVYTGLTAKDEALIFYLLQERRRNLTSWQKFKARLEAEDPVAIDLQRIVEEAGFVLNSTDSYRSVQAVGALIAVYRQDDGPWLLETTMQTLYDAWGDQETGVTSSDMVRGVARFIQDREPDLDRLVLALKSVNPQVLKSQANIMASSANGGSSRGKAIADAIYSEYIKAGRRRSGITTP